MKKTSLYLDPELDARLARRAAEEGISKAEFIRRSLEGFITPSKRPKPSVGVFAGPADLAENAEAYLAGTAGR